MNHLKRGSLIILISTLMLMITGCDNQASQSVSANPSAVEPSASQQTMKSKQADTQAKEANWVIEINDTQQITDDEGLIWNYHLSMNATKNGGKDVVGSYKGKIVLNMEPDLNSAKALAKKEGADLISMLFKHHSEANDVTFEVLKYSPGTRSELVKKNIPNNQPLQINNPYLTPPDAFTVTRITFNVTQEPINLTLSDGEASASTTIPGGKTSVNVPMEISINGATAYCSLFETIHTLDRLFKGVITGEVNPQ